MTATSADSIAWMLTPADSASVVSNVYTVSLLAIVPIVVAGVAALLLRNAPAGTRSLIWRSASLALLFTFLARQFSFNGMAWTLPNFLATPLVLLGRVQVTGGNNSLPAAEHSQSSMTMLAGNGALIVQLLVLIYLTGVAFLLLRTTISTAMSIGRAARARPIRDNHWLQQLRDARQTLAVRRNVTIRISTDTSVPRTIGFLRPVIIVPSSADQWSSEHRRAVLLHELAHIRSYDWLMAIITEIVCAFYWFHPGAWWIARGLGREREYACDDTVLAAGVRPSDYAELLALAAETLRVPARERRTAIALSRGAGVRERLRAILDTSRDVRGPGITRQLAAVSLAVVVSMSVGAVRLAPNKEVLSELMRDTRWESRAYAVLGLAQRTDSIAAARQVAASDPSPQVRAWAQYALARRNNSSRN
jgi:beta-lactamase regulating signal transducer with metallopeptidase domain